MHLIILSMTERELRNRGISPLYTVSCFGIRMNFDLSRIEPILLRLDISIAIRLVIN